MGITGVEAHAGGTRAAALRFVAPAAALLASGCAGPLSTLDPAGEAAAWIATLWWAMLAGAVLILAGVMAAALYALVRRRRETPVPDRVLLAGGGLIFPGVVLGALLTWGLLLGERVIARAEPDAVHVEAHAYRWGWSFRYPGGAVLPELHLPAGQTTLLAVTSDDVIHSVWIPRLAGKVDAIPGKRNLLRLEPLRPGTHRGVCAEFCGVGHTGMDFAVHVHPPREFAAAVAAAQAERRP